MKERVRNRIKGVVVLLLTICIMCSESIGIFAGTATYASNPYPIMGETDVTLGQMINYYEANATYPAYYSGTDAPNIYVFCKLYIEECVAEGVRTQVAFAQAMKETGFLRFGGDVSITQFNFAGIGATGGGVAGNSFPSVRIGIRAQVQHLKAYATTEPLNNAVVDPRYQYVPKGSASYVQWLGKHENPTGVGWATALGYGDSIVDSYIAKMEATSTYSSWYAGVDYSSIYDPEYYMQNNPDVASVYGGSSNALIEHFLRCGMDEGRVASSNFNIDSYRLRYKDLRTVYGYDLKSYYYHYLNAGRYEGRTATGILTSMEGVTIYNGVDYAAIYDYNYYINKYPDVYRAYGNDDIAVLKHFVEFGMNEGRQASASFDVNSYMRRYKDLRTAFGNNLKAYYLHYMNNGIAEKRVAVGEVSIADGVTVYNGVDYSAIYNYNYYISKYADIKAAYGDDDIAVLEHFVTCGMAEGRQASATFDVNSYRRRYKDLRMVFGQNMKAYYQHYLDNGQYEKRITTGNIAELDGVTVYDGVDYGAVYNYNYYVNKYPDIQAAYGDDDIAVLEHFVNCGMNEGRIASTNFNEQQYVSRYADLQGAFGTDSRSYYIHYLTFGIREGRIGN